jgi:hypothetical protein
MRLALSIAVAALALAAGPATAQTRVSVVVGVHVPPVHGTVIIGPRYPARHEVIVVPRYRRYHSSRGLVVVRRGPPYGRGRGHGYGRRHFRHPYWR